MASDKEKCFFLFDFHFLNFISICSLKKKKTSYFVNSFHGDDLGFGGLYQLLTKGLWLTLLWNFLHVAPDKL